MHSSRARQLWRSPGRRSQATLGRRSVAALVRSQGAKGTLLVEPPALGVEVGTHDEAAFGRSHVKSAASAAKWETLDGVEASHGGADAGHEARCAIVEKARFTGQAVGETRRVARGRGPVMATWASPSPLNTAIGRESGDHRMKFRKRASVSSLAGRGEDLAADL